MRSPAALEPHPIPILSPLCPHSLAETRFAPVSSLSVVIATNFEVETKAREAYSYNYHQVFVEDAVNALSASLLPQEFFMPSSFPQNVQSRA